MKHDSQIQRDIIDQLRWDLSVGNPEIGVAVSVGVARGSGLTSAETL